MADHIRLSLKMHVVMPEYAGYGIYRGVDGNVIRPSTERLLEDALTIFTYFTATVSEMAKADEAAEDGDDDSENNEAGDKNRC